MTDAEVVDLPHLPPEVSAAALTASSHAVRRGGTFRQAVRDAEAAILKEAMERYRTQMLSARHLGLGQATISRKLKKYGLR